MPKNFSICNKDENTHTHSRAASNILETSLLVKAKVLQSLGEQETPHYPALWYRFLNRDWWATIMDFEQELLKHLPTDKGSWVSTMWVLAFTTTRPLPFIFTFTLFYCQVRIWFAIIGFCISTHAIVEEGQGRIREKRKEERRTEGRASAASYPLHFEKTDRPTLGLATTQDYTFWTFATREHESDYLRSYILSGNIWRSGKHWRE